jgi:tetraacyldisaccharide-1-P 4'-kinase
MRADLVVPLDWPTETLQTGFLDPDGPHHESIEGKVALLCAIGSPEKFADAMVKMGIEVVHREFLPDHDPLTAGTLFQNIPQGMPVVVTPKDWVKLKKRNDIGGRRIYVATQSVRFAETEKLALMFKRTLDEIDAQKD